MDYEDEWEFLPDPRFLDFPEDSEKKVFSGKRRGSNPKGVFDMNYFMCPEASPGDSRKVAKQFVPVPIQLEPASIMKGSKDDELMKNEIIKKPVHVTGFVPSAITEKIKGSDAGSIETDQDAVSQVFFKKMKENEFVDMKILDSPKSPRNIIPQVDQPAALENINPCSPRKKKNNNNMVDFDASNKDQDDHDHDNQISWEEHNNLGLNLWKWSLTGIGAICSFGVAAATVCVIIFGNKHQQQNQKLRFQIYSDDNKVQISKTLYKNFTHPRKNFDSFSRIQLSN